MGAVKLRPAQPTSTGGDKLGHSCGRSPFGLSMVPAYRLEVVLAKSNVPEGDIIQILVDCTGLVHFVSLVRSRSAKASCATTVPASLSY